MKLIDGKCNSCPAFHQRSPEQIERIEYWYALFLGELRQIKPVKVILLGESYPATRYFYDLDSNYENRGLMYNLKQEFGISTNKKMIIKFRELGVVVYDCAFCPLHLLENKTDQRHAATHCLKSYKLEFFKENTAPIITFFQSKRGFLKSDLPEIEKDRIAGAFNFNSLHGIKNLILSIA